MKTHEKSISKQTSQPFDRDYRSTSFQLEFAESASSGVLFHLQQQAPSLEMVKEGNEEKKIVLTKPLLLEGESNVEYRVPNLLQRILSLFNNVRRGEDLTRFQLPATFNVPKSHLQCFGESMYCFSKDLLTNCNRSETPQGRFISVVAWSISTSRPPIFGTAPYNAILGETHHVSVGNLNVLLEQVSHHPPVSALHATDEKENIELIWCQHPVAKFCGTSVEAEVHGKRELKLHNHGETYVMNSPKLSIRFLPIPGTEWVGDVRIKCQETGLEAQFCYGTNSFLGLRGNHRAIKGKIFESSSKKTLYEIDGHWDRTVSVKDPKNRNWRVIFSAKEVLYGLKAPIVKDSQAVLESESAVVWSEVSEGILSQDWQKAKEAKKVVEDKQRELLKERESQGKTWIPKHFRVSNTKESGWDCSPIQELVPPSPITVPI